MAAKTGNFICAVEELGVTQGAISRQVLQIENFYGQPLFLRQARGLTLTEASRQLEETARVAFDQIAQTTRALCRRLEARELRFMLPTCAMLWTMPLLTPFLACRPRFRISVITTLFHATDANVFDIGIVYDRLDNPRLHRKRTNPADRRLWLDAAQGFPTSSPQTGSGPSNPHRSSAQSPSFNFHT